MIGLGLAMLMLVAVGMTSAASGTIKTNTDEDIKGAISAAYAGVQDYQSRLALHSTYYKFGNPAAPFSASSAASLSVPTPANSQPGIRLNAVGQLGARSRTRTRSIPTRRAPTSATRWTTATTRPRA